jgi:hypothetical protein
MTDQARRPSANRAGAQQDGESSQPDPRWRRARLKRRAASPNNAGLEVTVTLLIVLALLIALDLGAWWWSHDSRDGRDWRS